MTSPFISLNFQNPEVQSNFALTENARICSTMGASNSLKKWTQSVMFIQIKELF